MTARRTHGGHGRQRACFVQFPKTRCRDALRSVEPLGPWRRAVPPTRRTGLDPGCNQRDKLQPRAPPVTDSSRSVVDVHNPTADRWDRHARVGTQFRRVNLIAVYVLIQVFDSPSGAWLAQASRRRSRELRRAARWRRHLAIARLLTTHRSSSLMIGGMFARCSPCCQLSNLCCHRNKACALSHLLVRSPCASDSVDARRVHYGSQGIAVAAAHGVLAGRTTSIF
jgi:hypothetical protein